jgi:hypothetical protein
VHGAAGAESAAPLPATKAAFADDDHISEVRSE